MLRLRMLCELVRQGKLKSKLKKPKKQGPTSTADVRKMKKMDSVLGVEPIDFSEKEGDGDMEKTVRSKDADLFPAPLSPKSSL
uniref:Uncharacterized protein n=1 Tax=Cannabis sativa TaxID=3483 RepID=A0A803PNB9_CANSA